MVGFGSFKNTTFILLNSLDTKSTTFRVSVFRKRKGRWETPSSRIYVWRSSFIEVLKSLKFPNFNTAFLKILILKKREALSFKDHKNKTLVLSRPKYLIPTKKLCLISYKSVVIAELDVYNCPGGGSTRRSQTWKKLKISLNYFLKKV